MMSSHDLREEEGRDKEEGYSVRRYMQTARDCPECGQPLLYDRLTDRHLCTHNVKALREIQAALSAHEELWRDLPGGTVVVVGDGVETEVTRPKGGGE